MQVILLENISKLGKIGDQATDEWKANPDKIPQTEVLETKEDVQKKQATVGAGAIIGSAIMLLLLL